MDQAQITKWLGSSKTIWGMIITVASTAGPVLGPLFGYDGVNPADIQEVGSTVWEMVSAVGLGVGTLLTIYGRMTAKGPATILPA